MTALEASTVACRTLQDGTLRVTVDIEPQHAQAAFALFGTPGRGVGMAALKDGREAIEPAPQPARAPRVMTDAQREQAAANWGRLGTLCKTAVAWCNVPDFQQWLGVRDAKQASERIKVICQIASRKELDTNPQATVAFRQHVVAPYQRHMQAKGNHGSNH